MECVNRTNFAVLVNRLPIRPFKASSRIQQGCPFSHFLFFPVMKGLSLLLNQGTREGRIKGIQISFLVNLIQLLFVDDVLLF